MSKKTKAKLIGQDSYTDQNCQGVTNSYNAAVQFVTNGAASVKEHVTDVGNVMSEEVVDLGRHLNQMSTNGINAFNDFTTYVYREFIRPEPTTAVDQVVQILSDGFEDGSTAFSRVIGKAEHFAEHLLENM